MYDSHYSSSVLEQVFTHVKLAGVCSLLNTFVVGKFGITVQRKHVTRCKISEAVLRCAPCIYVVHIFLSLLFYSLSKIDYHCIR